MKTVWKALLAVAAVACMSAGDGSLTPELKAKVDHKLKELQSWSVDPRIVSAVKAYNAAPSAEAKAMNNEKWKGLTLLDPYVRSFSKNPLGEYLKTKRDETITEAFVSGADGNKVAFLAKTSAWCHKDKDKHKFPMSGRTWIGPLEMDDSSGQLQVQVSVPVLDGGRPIGSVVIGLSASRLK